MSRFSIILPVRNGGDYVHDCVGSILSQTVTDFNLHVLDNNSTDGTTEWLHSLTDNRISIHPAPKPLTIEENWHRALEIPKNKFVSALNLIHRFAFPDCFAKRVNVPKMCLV